MPAIEALGSNVEVFGVIDNILSTTFRVETHHLVALARLSCSFRNVIDHSVVMVDHPLTGRSFAFLSVFGFAEPANVIGGHDGNRSRGEERFAYHQWPQCRHCFLRVPSK